MTPLLLTCTCLLLPCCVPVTLSSNELQFYRDGVAEVAKGIVLREFALARALENQEHQERPLPLTGLSPFLIKQPHKKYHLERDEKNERYPFNPLPNEPQLPGIWRKGNLGEWEYPRPMGFDMPMGRMELARKEDDYGKPYYETNVLGRIKGHPKTYPSSKLSYFPPGSLHNQRTLGFPDEVNLPYRMQLPWNHKQSDVIQKSFEEPRQVYHPHVSHIEEAPGNSKYWPKHVQWPSGPEFTFEFDDSNLGEKHPFAVKPNDPRYYRDSAFFSDTRASNDDEPGPSLPKDESNSPNDDQWEHFSETSTPPDEELEPPVPEDETVEKTMSSNYKDISVLAMNNLNNDIYFIAIVAGCSAAAMFALVLISLTWCRLQRGVKAAADIEYPAYGVTGPNKDVSPSGDQRLAHSAQMYHFQHQKQQIIAMENRASAGRDPGSVSEAESDEENDEGHHTVYECPGLASTGELEVKNPLFQDDSIPVTPSQSANEKDHM